MPSGRRRSRHASIKALTGKALEESSKHTFPSRGDAHHTAIKSFQNANMQILGSLALCAKIKGSRLWLTPQNFHLSEPWKVEV